MEEDLKTIRRECYLDPVAFCRHFFPHWFARPVPWVHRGIMAIVLRRTAFLHKYGELDKIIKNFRWRPPGADENSPDFPIFVLQPDGKIALCVERYTLQMLPRGFAKTTICNALTIMAIVYNDARFILYVSESETHSSAQVRTIKGELTGNARLITVFGSLRPASDSDRVWQSDLFETTNGVTVTARGRGGQVRGINVRGQRPDRIIVDDLEDMEVVETELQRKKVRYWAFRELIPALPAMDPNATMIVLGTLLHQDALLTYFQRDSRFTSIVFGATDRDGQPLWPDNLTLEQQERLKQNFAEAGDLAGYYREYHNTIRGEEQQLFKPRYLKWGSPDRPIRTGIAVDPAISNSTKASRATIAVVGMEESGQIWVLDVWGNIGVSPRELIDQYFLLHKKWNCEKAGVESIGYQAALIHIMREEMFRKKRYFEIIPITHEKEKKARIKAVLQPRYAAGYVTHRARFPDLETQLLDFPAGKLDDMDAVAMAVTLLDPYAAQAAGEDLTQDEYEPLEMAMLGVGA